MSEQRLLGIGTISLWETQSAVDMIVAAESGIWER